LFLKAIIVNKYDIAFDNCSISLIDGFANVSDVSAGGPIVRLQGIDSSGGGKTDVAFATTEGIVSVLDVALGTRTISHDARLRLGRVGRRALARKRSLRWSRRRLDYCCGTMN
jgi:hypothetical protein